VRTRVLNQPIIAECCDRQRRHLVPPPTTNNHQLPLAATNLHQPPTTTHRHQPPPRTNTNDDDHQGNFAKVKHARHSLTGVEVAIKIVDKTSLNESSMGKVRCAVRWAGEPA